jgi:tetratricopeptide (TPR) repeat protein
LNKGAKEGSDSKLILLNSFDAIHKMVMQDLNSGNPDLVALEGLYRQIEGLFGHRPLQSIEMLTVSWSKMKRKSSLLSKLGDLESRIGNFEKGRQDQIQALSMFESEGDRSGQAKALTLLGDVDQRTASVVVARENFEKALLLYTDAKKPIGAANVMIRLARLELRLGHFDTAIAKYENAKQLFEKNGARIGQANALRGIADIYRRKKPISEASKFYQEALDLYKAEHDSLGQANTYKSLADIEVQAGNIEIARTMYGQALTLCEDVHNRVGAANVWRALGDLDAELDAILARSNYDQAMLLYQATGDRLGQANTFASLGYLLQRTGEHEEAIKKYVFAIQRYVTSRTPEPQVKTLLALADSHNALLQIDERDQTLIDALICISDNRLPRLFSLFMQSLIRICGDKEAVEIWLAEHDFAFSTELSITDAI